MRTNRDRAKELLAVGILGGRSNLRQRIELLLRRGREFSGRVSMSRVVITAAVLMLLAALGAQAPRWIAFAQPAPRPSFEVASIKPADPNDGRFFIGSQPGGRFNANANLKMLIGMAYDVRNHQMSGGPNWMESAKWDITAKAEEGALQPGPDGGAKMRAMIQSLLEDRFKLAMHRETREEQVYDLVVAKGGPKLKQAVDTGKKGQGRMGMGRGQLKGMAAGIAILVQTLSQQLGRSVIDKTGLTGKYDFTLTYTPEPGQGGAFGPPPPGVEPPPVDPNGPSIFTAVQEQLGLRLESTKGPVEMLVIDRAEKPAEN